VSVTFTITFALLRVGSFLIALSISERTWVMSVACPAVVPCCCPEAIPDC